MARLTNYIRTRISENLRLAMANSKKRASLEEKRAKESEKLLPLILKKNKAIMDSLPTGYFPELGTIRVTVPSKQAEEVVKQAVKLKFIKPRRLPANIAHSGAYDVSHLVTIPQSRAIIKACADIVAYDQSVTDIRNAARENLNGYTTVEKLLEAWPEAKEYLPGLTRERIKSKQMVVSFAGVKDSLKTVLP